MSGRYCVRERFDRQARASRRGVEMRACAEGNRDAGLRAPHPRQGTALHQVKEGK